MRDLWAGVSYKSAEMLSYPSDKVGACIDVLGRARHQTIETAMRHGLSDIKVRFHSGFPQRGVHADCVREQKISGACAKIGRRKGPAEIAIERREVRAA